MRKLATTEELKNLLGPRIIELRKAKGMTQVELAEQIQVTQAAMCNIEKGNWLPTRETVDKICQVLGIDRYLLEAAPE